MSVQHFPAEQIDAAREVDILAIAQRYSALKRDGVSEHVGPCPVCGGEDWFSVHIRKHVWHCRGCAKGGDVISLIQHLDGVSFVEAVKTLTSETWIPHRRSDTKASTGRIADAGSQDADRNSRLALGIWDGARSIQGTLAEAYLVSVRGIAIEQIPELDEVLRFEPRCPFGGDRLPCLVALIRNIASDAPQAIQRTALDAAGRKIERRSLGPKTGGAMKLWPDAALTTSLVVGEGLETVAAAATRIVHRGALLQPAWALIDKGNLKKFPVLSGIEALTILVDNDSNKAGQNAADGCTARWLDADRCIEQLIPNQIDKRLQRCRCRVAP